jgi:DNA-binding helix-hairpin-helix protein with protein kinase domain
MRVRWQETGEELTLSGPLPGQGGESAIYSVPDRPGLAACLCSESRLLAWGDGYTRRLASLLASPPPGRIADGHPVLAWPVGRLLAMGSRPARVVGYLMPRAPHARPLEDYARPASRRQTQPLFHPGYLIRTARNLASAVQVVHAAGLVIGDLHGDRVLVNSQALVTLTGVDTFQMPGASPVPGPSRLDRPEHTPPELQGVAPGSIEPRPEHDAFALAVLIFRLLMQGVHPFAGPTSGGEEGASLAARIVAGHWPYAWERAGPVRPSPDAPPWEVLPPGVQELFWRCFEDGHGQPAARPSAAEWRDVLDEAEERLAACGSNPQHVYPWGLDRCPWCVLAREQGRDPFPSLEEVRAAGHDFAPARALPPPGVASPADGVGTGPGGTESGLGQLGAAVERRPWLVWLGVGSAGAMAGLLWALLKQPAPEAAPADPAIATAPATVQPRPASKAEGSPSREEAARRQALEEYRQAEARYRQAVQVYSRVIVEQRRGQAGASAVARAKQGVEREQEKLSEAQRRIREKVYGPEEDGPGR